MQFSMRYKLCSINPSEYDLYAFCIRLLIFWRMRKIFSKSLNYLSLWPDRFIALLMLAKIIWFFDFSLKAKMFYIWHVFASRFYRFHKSIIQHDWASWQFNKNLIVFYDNIHSSLYKNLLQTFSCKIVCFIIQAKFIIQVAILTYFTCLLLFKYTLTFYSNLEVEKKFIT